MAALHDPAVVGRRGIRYDQEQGNKKDERKPCKASEHGYHPFFVPAAAIDQVNAVAPWASGFGWVAGGTPTRGLVDKSSFGPTCRQDRRINPLIRNYKHILVRRTLEILQCTIANLNKSAACAAGATRERATSWDYAGRAGSHVEIRARVTMIAPCGLL
jgi:hypothetical protein